MEAKEKDRAIGDQLLWFSTSYLAGTSFYSAFQDTFDTSEIYGSTGTNARILMLETSPDEDTEGSKIFCSDAPMRIFDIYHVQDIQEHRILKC